MVLKRLAIMHSMLSLTTLAIAQTYDVSWHTIAGGGQNSAGGPFLLAGTIGQHDASSFGSPMSGGAFELVGGFWPAASVVCTCPGDMNSDGNRNGRDIQQFAACMIAGGSCSCADVDGSPGLSSGDVTVFVSNLLVSTGCP